MSFKLGIDNRIVKSEFTTNRNKKIMTYKAEVLFWLGLENRVKYYNLDRSKLLYSKKRTR